MPKAEDYLTDEWNGPSEETALRYKKIYSYLLERFELKNVNFYMWKPKPGTVVNDKDRRAALFMQQEWDYGFIVEEST